MFHCKKYIKFRWFSLLFSVLIFLLAINLTPGTHSMAATREIPQSKLTVRSIRIQMNGLKEARLDLARKVLFEDPGVLNVKFKLEQKEAQIQFDIEKTNLAALDKSIRKAGFSPWYH
jgi:Heavy-metal-associated domain